MNECVNVSMNECSVATLRETFRPVIKVGTRPVLRASFSQPWAPRTLWAGGPRFLGRGGGGAAVWAGRPRRPERDQLWPPLGDAAL